jgi:hypothetical protein
MDKTEKFYRKHRRAGKHQPEIAEGQNFLIDIDGTITDDV